MTPARSISAPGNFWAQRAAAWPPHDNSNSIRSYDAHPAEPNGLVYWSNVLDHDANALPRITAAFASSSEYQVDIAGKNYAQVVDTVYQHLFGRAGDAAGIAYWADLLDRHVLTIDNLVTAVAKGALTTDLFAFNAKVASGGARIARRSGWPQGQHTQAGLAADRTH